MVYSLYLKSACEKSTVEPPELVDSTPGTQALLEAKVKIVAFTVLVLVEGTQA